MGIILGPLGIEEAPVDKGFASIPLGITEESEGASQMPQESADISQPEPDQGWTWSGALTEAPEADSFEFTPPEADQVWTWSGALTEGTDGLSMVGVEVGIDLPEPDYGLPVAFFDAAADMPMDTDFLM